MPKTLYLPIKKQWFDLIKAGIKTEEYRDDIPFYQSRLICQTEDQEKDSYDLIYGGNIIGGVNHLAIQKMRRYDFVEFRNGYAKNAPKIRFKNPRARYDFGKPEWGAEPDKLYFVITWENQNDNSRNYKPI